MSDWMKPGSRFVSDDNVLRISLGYLVFAVLLSLCLIIVFDDFRVFGSFWTSGDAWRRGLNPFSPQPLSWVVAIPGPDVVDVNLNPPTVLPLVILFTLAPMKTAAVAWLLVSLAMALGSLTITARSAGASKLKLAWALSCAALVDTLMLGQIYGLLLLLGTGVHFGLRSDRHVLTSVCLGLIVAIKPNFAVAIAILFLSGHWRLAVGSGAVAGLVTALSVVAFGYDTFLQWFAAVRADDHAMFPTTVSLISYFARLHLLPAGIASAGIILLVGAVWAYRTRPDPQRALALGLVVGMLASPLCWMHYTLVIVPFLVTNDWNRPIGIGAMLIWLPQSIPMISIRESFMLQASLGGIYTLALLLIGYGIMRIATVPQAAGPKTLHAGTTAGRILDCAPRTGSFRSGIAS